MENISWLKDNILQQYVHVCNTNVFILRKLPSDKRFTQIPSEVVIKWTQ